MQSNKEFSGSANPSEPALIWIMMKRYPYSNRLPRLSVYITFVFACLSFASNIQAVIFANRQRAWVTDAFTSL